MKSRSGQVVVLLAFALAAVALLTLLNVDTFIAVRAKNRVQNAGDAAALAAARTQGSLLNEIGRLNVEHIVAAAQDRTNDCRDIVLRQRRLALLGPVDALVRANEAAKKNGQKVRREFADILRAHVSDILLVYASGSGQDADAEPYPEPYPGAWAEYAACIANAIAPGLAVGPDNMEFYDSAGGHLLLDRRFYHAVAGRDWCWFFFNCHDVLKSYSGYGDWAPLPARRGNPLDNSEIFSLHVVSRPLALRDAFPAAELRTLLDRYSDGRVTDEEIAGSQLLGDPEEPWFLYDGGTWRRWFDGLALADDPDGGEFPLAGEIRPEYNVRGCAAICRCQRMVETVAVDSTPDYTWAAAAKPFGVLGDPGGNVGPATGARGLVLPCFTDARLVPLDSVGGEDLATADFAWVRHLREHLGDYLAEGPRFSKCFYCEQLRVWEHASFRREGVRWLERNSHTCRRGSGGSSGRGGTSHGH